MCYHMFDHIYNTFVVCSYETNCHSDCCIRVINIFAAYSIIRLMFEGNNKCGFFLCSPLCHFLGFSYLTSYVVSLILFSSKRKKSEIVYNIDHSVIIREKKKAGVVRVIIKRNHSDAVIEK